MTEHTLNTSWACLKGKIVPSILCAPKTCGDPSGAWSPVHERVVGYLLRNVVGKPWADHVALAAAVLSARRRDVRTISLIVQDLHLRFSDLFQAFQLETMQGWNADIYIPPYLKGEVVPEASAYTRFSFLRKYVSATKHLKDWLDTLPPSVQEVYRAFVIQPVNSLLVEGLDNREEIESQREQIRKGETEAIVPQFAELRAEAHFRFNKLTRLRQAYHTAVEAYQKSATSFPFEFSYDEGEPPNERLHFRLWDRRSFVKAHAEHYSYMARSCAESGKRAYSDARNELFLEFVKSERLNDNAPPEEFWFTELLRLHVLGLSPKAGTEEEKHKRQTWLRNWGYGEPHSSSLTAPFEANTPGLLTWGSSGLFMAGAQKRAAGVLVPVNTLYAAACFGLLALDILTTTGMRINELMQISLSKTCIIQLQDDPPPEARDQSPRIRYLLRLLPKGEHTTILQNYGISKETIRLIEKTCQMLCEHYELQPGETLPHVAFHANNGRSHRFGVAAYLFQYGRHHLSDYAITACMRFLIHGMVFQTAEGKPVVIKPHLLRHAFATYAVQVEQIPIDLVAQWLKQKNLEVTNYYSKKTPQMAAEEHVTFLDRLTTQINVREAIIRSPKEIQKQAEEARKRVGTLVPVAGGECTLDAYCPNQFECIHCPSKAPDPAKRYQVEEKQRWSRERLHYYEQEGLVLETERMKKLLRDCELELKEMDQIGAYRKDENRVIQVQPRTKRT